jgi:acyl-coenzyme A thioesterase PaaI-like protein
MIELNSLKSQLENSTNTSLNFAAVPFRLSGEKLILKVENFNRRREITWFGLEGSLNSNTQVIVKFTSAQSGVLGGGGVDAVNGGVIAAGFDAVCVLAGLTQFDVDVVVTLTLQVQFLRLATNSPHLEFQACVTKSARHICFAHGILIDRAIGENTPLAIASATLAPFG